MLAANVQDNVDTKSTRTAKVSFLSKGIILSLFDF